MGFSTLRIFTLASPLHDREAVAKSVRTFLDGLNTDYELAGTDFSDCGSGLLDIICICTGGTENMFCSLLPQILANAQKRQWGVRPFWLIATGEANSLAASMEILSYLRLRGLRGEILHGALSERLSLMQRAAQAFARLQGCRVGVIGKPSDWLVASTYDEAAISRLGITLVQIGIDELLDVARTKEPRSLPEEARNGVWEHRAKEALKVEEALDEIVGKYNLQAFTLRCFDLLTALHTTGCWPLSRINSRSVVAGCEGDVPALLSMLLVRQLTGVSGFQANPARIDTLRGQVLLAHCTIPENMVLRTEWDTHFESGIGIGIRGYMKEGPVTLFKMSGDLSRYFVAEGTLLRNTAEPGLCRTQLLIQLDDRAKSEYFLTNPIGNHHIVAPGRIGGQLEELMKWI
jgi:L-fucose isomerase-like protein